MTAQTRHGGHRQPVEDLNPRPSQRPRTDDHHEEEEVEEEQQQQNPEQHLQHRTNQLDHHAIQEPEPIQEPQQHPLDNQVEANPPRAPAPPHIGSWTTPEARTNIMREFEAMAVANYPALSSDSSGRRMYINHDGQATTPQWLYIPPTPQPRPHIQTPQAEPPTAPRPAVYRDSPDPGQRLDRVPTADVPGIISELTEMTTHAKATRDKGIISLANLAKRLKDDPLFVEGLVLVALTHHQGRQL